MGTILLMINHLIPPRVELSNNDVSPELRVCVAKRWMYVGVTENWVKLEWPPFSALVDPRYTTDDEVEVGTFLLPLLYLEL